jgi:hypothetical protein
MQHRLEMINVATQSRKPCRESAPNSEELRWRPCGTSVLRALHLRFRLAPTTEASAATLGGNGD